MPSAIDGSLPLDELLATTSSVISIRASMVRFGIGPDGGDEPKSASASHRNESPSNYVTRSTTSRSGGSTPTTGPLANWESLCMPRPCGSIRSLMEMGAPHGFSLIWCSPPSRIPRSGSTTGTFTSLGTSSCFAPTTDTGMSVSLLPSSQWSRSTHRPRNIGAPVAAQRGLGLNSETAVQRRWAVARLGVRMVAAALAVGAMLGPRRRRRRRGRCP